MTDIPTETDSLGEVEVGRDKLWDAQTQRSFEHFSIGHWMPGEMISAYAILKKAAGNANHAGKRLDDQLKRCDFSREYGWPSSWGRPPERLRCFGWERWGWWEQQCSCT